MSTTTIRTTPIRFASCGPESGNAGSAGAGPREGLRATLASYIGHFRHADSHRLIASLWRRYGWLGEWFVLRREGRLLALWEPRGVASLHGQWRWFRKRYPGAMTLMQVGNCVELHGDDALRVTALGGLGGKPAARAGWPAPGLAWPVAVARSLMRRLCRQGDDVNFVREEGWLRGGLKRRVLRAHWLGVPTGNAAGAA